MDAPIKTEPRFYTVPAGTPARVCNGPSCTQRVYWITVGKRRVPIDCHVDGGAVPTARYDPRQLDAFDNTIATRDGRGRLHNELCVDRQHGDVS